MTCTKLPVHAARVVYSLQWPQEKFNGGLYFSFTTRAAEQLLPMARILGFSVRFYWHSRSESGCLLHNSLREIQTQLLLFALNNGLRGYFDAF